jgi:crotonobetainyl-CoA:carnitine CoA-transferase CaiB-like acyl-CoA transferase
VESLQRDCHLQAVGLIQFEEHPTEGKTAAIRPTVQFDGAYPSRRAPSQPRGSDTREILMEIGYGASEIDTLMSVGAAIANARTARVPPASTPAKSPDAPAEPTA